MVHKEKHRGEWPCVLGMSQDENNHLLNLQHVANGSSNTYVQRGGLGEKRDEIEMSSLVLLAILIIRLGYSYEEDIIDSDF